MIFLREAIKLALQSLWQNKMRTVLTLLCMTIAVSSIIAVLTLVYGANTYVTTNSPLRLGCVYGIEDAALIINSMAYLRYQAQGRPYSDYEYVRDNCKRCVGMGAMQTIAAKVVHGTQSITLDCTVRGYTWQMPSLQNLNIMSGRATGWSRTSSSSFGRTISSSRCTAASTKRSCG